MNSSMKKVAILTSGGDAQGMNACVRAVVRKTIQLGGEAYLVMNGYQGLYENSIHRAKWHDVEGIIQQGGTFIGTARCKAFMQREGRKVVAKNLLKIGIDRLVVIGGDGSLTGASNLQQEWFSLLQEIVEEDKKAKESNNSNKKDFFGEDILSQHRHLTIIGMVGSIDNDLSGSTDLTIGADSALNQIIRAVDAVTSTASSHQREFVIEVMGRNCGWLALCGAIATGADWLLIPESPIEDGWKEKICQQIKKGKAMGRRSSIVMLAEGARDVKGKPITSSDVKEALDAAGFDTRITILGHVQRGGSPSAWDRNQSTILGIKAAELALSESENLPVVLGIIRNKIQVTPLNECLRNNEEIVKSIVERNFTKAMELRGRDFKDSFSILQTLTAINPSESSKIRTAILHIGACSPGMNTAVRVLTRLGISRGHAVFGVKNGLEGFLNDDIFPLQWMSVNGWASKGGAFLGIKRNQNFEKFDEVVASIERHKFNNIVIVGGWDAYSIVVQLEKQKKNFPYLNNISIVILPASISNNLPCTDYSVGSDTSLNNIVECCDKIKQSAVSSSKVFFVEVMGTTGYLTTMCGLASGADKIYIEEEKITLDRLEKDIKEIVHMFEIHPQSSSLVINNEHSSKAFSTPMLAKIFEDQSGNSFEVRTATLGHIQQGGSPSGMDRIFATQLASKIVECLDEQFTKKGTFWGCAGMTDGTIRMSTFEDMLQDMNLEKRCCINDWWNRIIPYIHQINSCVHISKGESI